jgi:hypothetical protein
MALIETIPVKEDYRRKIAQQLMRDGMSSEPILHWAQGLGRLGQAALGGYQMYQADQKDKETEEAGYSGLAAALERFSGGGVPSAQPSPQNPTASPPAPMTSVNPQAGAVPATLAAQPPKDPTNPNGGTYGGLGWRPIDSEPPPEPTKTAAPSPMVPTPVKTEAIQPTAAPPVVPTPTAPEMDAAKAKLSQMVAILRDRNVSPQEKKTTAKMAEMLAGQVLKPNEYDFKVVGENLVKTDKNGNASVVPGMSASKPQWTDTGEKDQNGNPVMGWVNPSDKSVTPYRPQGSTTPATITGPDGKPITVQPGQDPKIIREAASKRAAEEAMPASGDSVSKLRNEVQGLPSYKNIAQAAPVYKSMLEAAGRDTRAADVNMIYGMAKIMDPGSVVRESEMTVAQAIATLPQQLQATVQSQLQSSGRLTPEVREAIMQEAHSRIGSYQSMFDQDISMYRGIAQRGRMNEADVLPSFGPYEQYKRATKGGNKTKSGVSWSVEP